MSIADNLATVRERMAAAARRAGRDPRSLALMAVTKQVEPRRIREAYEAGVRLFGENRVQEFGEKINLLRDLKEAEWRLIGHLQSNKTVRASELFHGIDSLDSWRVAEKLNAAARQRGRTMPVLLEINLGGEPHKTGFPPRLAGALEAMLSSAAGLEKLAVEGLMAIPPQGENPEDARHYFRQLRQLRDEIAARRLPSIALETLSMGMTQDFEVAIEEGSTCVRVGTAIFGPRPGP